MEVACCKELRCVANSTDNAGYIYIFFLSPNNPIREVNGTAKLGRINTQWHIDYLAVLCLGSTVVKVELHLQRNRRLSLKLR